MATTDITSLRKAGRLDEAYHLAKEAFDEDPYNIWNRRALAWCVYDYAKANATADKRLNFIRCLQNLIDLKMPDDEQFFHDGVGWLVRGMIATCCRAKVNDWAFYDNVVLMLEKFCLTRPSEMYSALLQTVIRLKNEWPGFVGFCQWWGFDNLRAEDYKSSTNDDGIKLMSLAERFYMGYAKAVLNTGDKNQIEGFIPRISAIANAHHEYVYLPYYHAKLLIKVGRNSEAISAIKPFARRKSGEFWVWELLGDAMSDDNYRLKLYSKTLLCRSKPEMMVNIRENMAVLLIKLGHRAEAKREIMIVSEVRQKNKWNLTQTIISITGQEWYLKTKAIDDNTSFYRKNSEDAESLIFGVSKDQVEVVGVLKVTDKGFGFVTSDKHSVFVPSFFIEKLKLNNGDTVVCQAEKSFDKKKGKDGLKAIKIKRQNKRNV